MSRNLLICVALCVTVAAGTSCTSLTSSGPITVTQDNQVIENLDITTKNETAGITCKGYSGVTIKNVRVTHYPQGNDTDSVYEYAESDSSAGASSVPPPPPGSSTAPYSRGISFTSCDNIVIENVRVQLVDFPSGPFESPNYFNIYGSTSQSPSISNVIVSGGSSGVWLGDCDSPTLSNWAAYNVHGPFPRGQCTQFARATNSVVENFICKNQWFYSWPEDAISMWRSANATVRKGLIAGNSASTGVGMMFEQSTILENSWGLAQDMQVYKTGGCCFSTYGGTHINFDNVQCKENHCNGVDGRDAGSALMFYAGYENPSNESGCCYSSNISVTNGTWWDSCRCNAQGSYSGSSPSCMLWRSSANPNAWDTIDLVEEDFTINEHPIDLELCFTIDGEEYLASTVTETNVGLYGNGSINYSDASCTSDGICTQEGSLLESSSTTTEMVDTDYLNLPGGPVGYGATEMAANLDWSEYGSAAGQLQVTNTASGSAVALVGAVALLAAAIAMVVKTVLRRSQSETHLHMPVATSEI